MKKKNQNLNNLISGRIHATRRGAAYFTPEESEDRDLYIPADGLSDAMDGDLAQVRVSGVRFDGVREAAVTTVTERVHTRLVGTVFGSVVVPDDRKLPTLTLLYAKGEKHLPESAKVVAQITHYGDGRRPLLGRVVEVLGQVGDPGVDVMSVIRQHGLREEFPEPVRQAALRIPQTVTNAQLVGREDLREVVTFTIDGRDSKDFDDAVSIALDGNGNFELGVHIADVSAYVRANGLLDHEAQLRGTSVYFADRVLPMLPEELSNGICSLNEGADRLTLSCMMMVDANGGVVRSRIAETVIRSRYRLVYDDVSALLTWDGQQCEVAGYDAVRIAELTARYAGILPQLRLLEQLQGILSARRAQRGSIDFDVPESEITLDDRGRAIGLNRAQRGIANRIIEECMLLCNETVAHTMHAIDAPFLYRVHEAPDGDRLRELNGFLGTLGYTVRHVDSPAPRDIQAVLSQAAGTEEEGLIGKLMLRAMQRARYDGACLGHFGLASTEYCHFTSPIRRYPDLFIHRVIKLWIHKGLTEEKRQKLAAQSKRLAESTSAAERAAMEAERAVDQLKKCEYMQSRIGESFDGVVSGITAYGIYVELKNTAEGLVRLDALEDDYYVADVKQYRVTGRTHGRVIRLGDTLRIQVRSVDLSVPSIDFTPQTQYHKQKNKAIIVEKPPRKRDGGTGYGSQKSRKGEKGGRKALPAKQRGKQHATRKGRKTTGTKSKSKA